MRASLLSGYKRIKAITQGRWMPALLMAGGVEGWLIASRSRCQKSPFVTNQRPAGRVERSQPNAGRSMPTHMGAVPEAAPPSQAAAIRRAGQALNTATTGKS